MNKYFASIIFILITSLNVLGQTSSSIKGQVKDDATGETIIGASIQYADGKGTVTDIDGNYQLKLPDGEYTITMTYVGYAPQKQKVKVEGKSLTVNFVAKGTVLTTVEIVSDIAVDRKTPVAVSTISTLKLKEELAGRDLPMLLNSTPGVYATQSGGGAGDARITIRGFDQRNIAVLVDGIPVNDMENGQVYWSNWGGLGTITRNVQVQRGLGASKLAISSVGGTMNTITKGIDDKAGISVQEDIGSFNYVKQTLAFNTGRLKYGWGVTGAVSKETSNGYADQTWNKATSYFIKVEKSLGKHLISACTNGAPQSHGQRSSLMPAATLNRDYAIKHGGDTAIYQANSTLTTKERGQSYNSDWGYAGTGIINTAVNKFYKPLYSLRDYWNVNDKLYISTVAYASFATGGGTSNYPSLGTLQYRDTSNGQWDYTTIFNKNTGKIPGTTAIDKTYDSTLNKSTNITRIAENNHKWYGVLTSANYKIGKYLNYTGGVDLRTYTGYHYSKVYNLIGGDYYIDQGNKSLPYFSVKDPVTNKVTFPNAYNAVKKVGDKIIRDYEGHVTWAGVFNQLEFKKGNWSAFVTATVSQTGYKRVDNFARKDLHLSDTIATTLIANGDTAYYDANHQLVLSSAVTSGPNKHYIAKVDGDTTILTYKKEIRKLYKANRYTIDSKETQTAMIDWKYFIGYVVKGGINYNITEHMNVFTNFGQISKVQSFSNVYDLNNRPVLGVKNQKITTVELGYSLRFQKLAVNVNGYYTNWLNKPLDFPGTINIGDAQYSYNINGLTAIHKGFEMDFSYKVHPRITVEGTLSLADWRYNSGDSVRVYDQNGYKVGTLYYDAKGVHVGNAAQTQIGGNARWQLTNKLWIKGQYIYYDRNYADFNPTQLSDSRLNTNTNTLEPLADNQGKPLDNRRRESWKMPSYGTIDLHAGYSFKFEKANFTVMLHVLNVLNNVYISDASNAYFTNKLGNYNSDINSAGVFYGLPRRFNASIRLDF